MAINFSNINSARPAAYAAQMQQASQDRQQAASVSTQVRADARKTQANRFDIRADTAVEIHQMYRETSVNFSRSHDQIHLERCS